MVTRVTLGPGIVAVMVSAGIVQAVPTIEVGTHHLLPDTPGQKIDICVSGGDPVQGLNFNVQVGDGAAANGGVDIGPIITEADVVTGTIFDGNNTGQTDLVSMGLIVFRVVTTASGTVAADGLLATLTVDTTRITSGWFDLSLTNVAEKAFPPGVDTDFAGVPADITNGTIEIVPRPAETPEPESIPDGDAPPYGPGPDSDSDSDAEANNQQDDDQMEPAPPAGPCGTGAVQGILICTLLLFVAGWPNRAARHHGFQTRKIAGPSPDPHRDSRSLRRKSATG